MDFGYQTFLFSFYLLTDNLVPKRSSSSRRQIVMSKRTILLISLLFSTVIIVGGCIVGNFLLMFLEPISSSFICKEHQHDLELHSSSIYIPGAGFSGFFYTLGRLQVLTDNEYNYHCFSAGCLALITYMLEVPINAVIELAYSSRNRYLSGEISRYDVVEYFVNGLLDKDAVHNNVSTSRSTKTGCQQYQVSNATKQSIRTISYDERIQKLQDSLPSINVITSTWDKHSFIISQRQEKPTSVKHLKRMLLETTYIPLITGDSLGIPRDEDGSFRYYNDGAFVGLLRRSELFDPSKYRHSLLLPWRFDILINGLNLFALDHAKAIHYWEEGVRRGI